MLTRASQQPLTRIACLTLDVESDHAGLVPQSHFEALEHLETWDWLAAFSRQRQLPWTAFVVGELLELRPGLAERLSQTGWELGLHSYSHNPHQADSQGEIARGKAAFRAAFGRDPLGYRAPLGNITRSGLLRLQEAGFQYDASVFPTWHPGKSNHLTWPTQPVLVKLNSHAPARKPNRDPETGTGASLPTTPELAEIPFAVVPGFRLIVSVSFVKLLGQSTYRLLLDRAGLTAVAVIDCHMHDLAPAPSAFKQLPPWWQAAYRRNRDQGKAALAWLVGWLESAGYRFATVSQVAGQVRQNGTGPGLGPYSP